MSAPNKYVAYAIVDTSTTPPTLVDVKFSRKEAREYVRSLGNYEGTGDYRVRRAKLTLFET